MDMLVNISALLIYFTHVLGGSVSKESAHLCSRLPTVQKTRVPSLGWEDLSEEITT